ncbi:MAG: ABC transporter permease [Clostridia bacterium]|nr:ABC transporter permease [Clostridia bacterium]
MNILFKITLASIKKNRTRTLVTIIGILLSCAMITAVTVSATSFHRFMLDNMLYTEGAWQASLSNTSRDVYQKVSALEEIDQISYGENIGYAKIDSANEDKPYLFVLGAGASLSELLPIHISSGRYPTAPNEILLPNHLASDGNVHYTLGETVTLSLGKRVLNGRTLWQDEFAYTFDTETGKHIDNGERFVPETETAYTVVGFYHLPSFESSMAAGYTAITLATNETDSYHGIYFTLDDPHGIFDLMKAHGLKGDTNTNVLVLLGVIRYHSFYAVFYGFLAIVIALIMLGSIVLIYNAFAISVSERTRDFALLSSVGATSDQLKKSVLWEAVVVSGIGTPLGILSGILGMAITFSLTGHMFLSLSDTITIPIRLLVDVPSIIAAVILTFVTVLISAYIPARRILKISPIEAIRQNQDIRLMARTAKTPHLIYRLFGISGALAHKHYKRNRKKYRATVISLFMSVVLFISASSLSLYLSQSIEISHGTSSYDLIYRGGMMTRDDAASLLQQMQTTDGITAATSFQEYMLATNIDRSLTTQIWQKNYADKILSPNTPNGQAHLIVRVLFVEDTTFRQLLSENSLDEDLYLNPDKPLALLYHNFLLFNSDDGKYVTGKILTDSYGSFISEHPKPLEGYTITEEYTDDHGTALCRLTREDDPNDSIILPRQDVYTARTLTYQNAIDTAPFFVDTASNLTLLYPTSSLDSLLPERKDSLSTSFVLCSEDHQKSETALRELLLRGAYDTRDLFNYAAEVQSNRDLITVINVFSYGFIVLISLIAAANVFHTVSTNIHLRKREFAMLRSVGMTSGALIRMMNYECLLYGTITLLFSIPTACAVTYLVYLVMQKSFSVSFFLPWYSIFIAIFSVFAVVFSSMLYAMRKLSIENPIEALKQETA